MEEGKRNEPEKQASQLVSQLEGFVKKGESLLLKVDLSAEDRAGIQVVVEKLSTLLRQTKGMSEVLAAAKLFHSSLQDLRDWQAKLERQVRVAKRKSVSGFMQAMREKGAKDHD